MKADHRILHLIAVLCIGAVGVALVSQHAFDMPPCAWCVFQRLIFLLVASVCWLSLLAARASAYATRVGLALSAIGALGGLVAGWYQHTVAAKMFSCDQTFADRFMVESGLDAGMPWLFGIFASCMDARVTVLGVEYVIWAMALFALIAALALYGLLRRPG
jgi:Disulfide bond formation protein DsbB